MSTLKLQQEKLPTLEIMYDKEYLYKSMTKDIYFPGKILAVRN